MRSDKEMLDFMISNSAKVIHTADDACSYACYVLYSDDNGDHITKTYETGRIAINAACDGDYTEY